ncbi:inovirus Gp2 family protein [Bacterioplanoides sp.]|uniref:inovirus Gp2 family protein n=1 Tax=Bacterioplanoides sp. TaxID=2066072 RepID=UPI003B59D6EB
MTNQYDSSIPFSSDSRPPVIQNHGPLNERYLDQIERTIEKAIQCHPRTMAVRVDLRFPACAARTDKSVISRFVDSLKAQIKADLKAKDRAGKRVHPCHLRYIWTREQDSGARQHYHVLLLLNLDTYRDLGRYDAAGGNLTHRIRSAWASAIGVPLCRLGGAVHIPDNPIYHLNINSSDFGDSFDALYYRTSYFAKQKTKQYGAGVRHFGCSSR